MTSRKRRRGFAIAAVSGGLLAFVAGCSLNPSGGTGVAWYAGLFAYCGGVIAAVVLWQRSDDAFDHSGQAGRDSSGTEDPGSDPVALRVDDIDGDLRSG